MMIKNSHDNLLQVVRILSDGHYHDGDSIGELLQITRSAVWKIIQKLLNYQIKIDSVKGKGYALVEPLILLDRAQIQKNQPEIEIHLFESIDSTNQYLKTFKQVKSPLVCLAEKQMAGKGRFNRAWHSPFGKNIYFSCLYPFQKDVSELAGLSLLTSLAIVDTLKNFGVGEGLALKWSNDVMFDGKKVSGNLIELQAETHAVCQAIIGIGINVNMLEEEETIQQPWTSMQKILNQYVDRNALCELLIKNLLDYLNRFNHQGFAPFVKSWNEWDCLVNKHISLTNVNQSFSGRMLGVNEQGYLLLELANGEIRTFSSGETTIMKNATL